MTRGAGQNTDDGCRGRTPRYPPGRPDREDGEPDGARSVLDPLVSRERPPLLSEGRQDAKAEPTLVGEGVPRDVGEHADHEGGDEEPGEGDGVPRRQCAQDVRAGGIPLRRQAPRDGERSELAHGRAQQRVPEHEQHERDRCRQCDIRVRRLVAERGAAQEQGQVRRHRADRDRRRQERRPHERQRDDGVRRSERHARSLSRRTDPRASSCLDAGPRRRPAVRP